MRRTARSGRRPERPSLWPRLLVAILPQLGLGCLFDATGAAPSPGPLAEAGSGEVLVAADRFGWDGASPSTLDSVSAEEGMADAAADGGGAAGEDGGVRLADAARSDSGRDGANGAADAGGLPVVWWNLAWTYRLRLELPAAAAEGSLSELPLLVTLTAPHFDRSLAAPSGTDLRFVDAQANVVLPHEIERWDVDKPIAVWVKLPRLERAQGKVIYVYYGGPADLPNERAREVWSDGFVGVWHLGPAGTLDSSPAAHHGTNHGSASAPGQIGLARRFAGRDYLEFPLPATLPLDQLTVEFWFRTKQSWDDPYYPGSAVLLTRATSGAGSGDWAIVGGRAAAEGDPGGRVIVGVGAKAASPEPNDFTLASPPALNDDAWHYIAWTRTRDGQNALFVDGERQAVLQDSGASITPDRPLQVGGEAYHPDGSYLDGEIDEVRVSAFARDPAWVRLQHRSMRDQLLRYGRTESR